MRKQSKFVRFLCYFVTFTLIFNTIAFSVCASNLSQNSIISESECADLAMYWIELYYDEHTLIKEIIPITNGEDVCSYCVSFISNDTPCGYIVVDSNRYAINNVTEFSFSGLGIYETLCANYGNNTIHTAKQKLIYSTGLYDYAISIDRGNTSFYSSSGDLLDSQELSTYCSKAKDLRAEINEEHNNNSLLAYSLNSDKEAYYNGFFTFGTLPSSGSYTPKTITNAVLYTPSLMNDLRVAGGYSGNCTPTAATNILSYYMEYRGFSNMGTSRQDIYNRIVNVSGWSHYTTRGMYFSEAKRGMKSVVDSAQYTFSSSTYLTDAWSNWTSALDNNKPVLTGVHGYKQDDSGNWVEAGHSIVAIGYLEYASGANYLRVWDGWYATSDRYIYFNSDYFTSYDGMTVSVTN